MANMKLLRAAGLLSALAVATVSPALAVTGDASSAMETYQASFTPQYEVGSYLGIMKLEVSRDGIVSGYFRKIDSGPFVPVTGGVDNGRIHLDFTWIGPTHVDGTYDGKVIAGSTMVDGRVYYFAATPNATQP